MRANEFVSESAQCTTTSWADHAFGAGRHLSAAGGTAASAALSRAGPSANCWMSASRFARSSAMLVTLQLAAQHLGHRLGREAELQERLAHVEVFAVRGDLAALELEEAHAPEPDLPPGAPRHCVAHDVAERPLGGRSAGRLDHGVHDPAVVPALAEHPLEHRAKLGLAAMLAVEVVAVAGGLGEAPDQSPDVLPVERLCEVVDDTHGPRFYRRDGRAQAEFIGGPGRSMISGTVQAPISGDERIDQ